MTHSSDEHADDTTVNVEAARDRANFARNDRAEPDPTSYGGFAALATGRHRVPDSERDWVGFTSESSDLPGCLTWPYVLFGFVVVTVRYALLGLTWSVRRLWRALARRRDQGVDR
jgi:hypothetical protein